jgi:hypothetical protein
MGKSNMGGKIGNGGIFGFFAFTILRFTITIYGIDKGNTEKQKTDYWRYTYG